MTTLGWLGVAAALLSLERICYVWAAHHPASFRAACAHPGLVRFGGPVEILERLFYLFKAIQGFVFVGWWWLFGDGSLRPAGATQGVLAAGATLVGIGQVLNFAVFHRLGRVGVFYGNRFGHAVPWRTGFPFSVVRHPQYTGTVLSIWGLFVMARFPEPDWALVPALETLYYIVGSRLESGADDDVVRAGQPARRAVLVERDAETDHVLDDDGVGGAEIAAE